MTATCEVMPDDGEIEPIHRLELIDGRRLCTMDGEPLAYVAYSSRLGGHRWCCRCGREYLETAPGGAESEMEMTAKVKKAKAEKAERELKQPDRAVIVLAGEIGMAIRKEAVARKLSLTALGTEMWAAYQKGRK
jgi:hypothetical protein